MLAHEGLKVTPRGVAAFGGRVRAFIQNLIENLQSLIRKPDLIGVGVDEQPVH